VLRRFVFAAWEIARVFGDSLRGGLAAVQSPTFAFHELLLVVLDVTDMLGHAQLEQRIAFEEGHADVAALRAGATPICPRWVTPGEAVVLMVEKTPACAGVFSLRGLQ